MIKQIFYDWFGLNAWLFHAINNIQGPSYSQFMLLVTELGNHDNVKYYIAATAVVLALGFLMRGVRRPGSIIWTEMKPALALLLTMIIGYVALEGAAHYLKESFALPRPYVVFPNAVHLPGGAPDPLQAYLTCPSGHACIAGFMAAVLWPHLSRLWRDMIDALAFLVCWSRIALGMHFPADVVYGALLGAVIASVTHRIVYRAVGAAA